MKNQATIVVQEDLVTWESSHDKCTFFRTKPSHAPTCTKCNKVKVEDFSKRPKANLGGKYNYIVTITEGMNRNDVINDWSNLHEIMPSVIVTM